MNKKELKAMKEDMKAKGKALADAHKANTKAIDAKHLERKPQSTEVITCMIARIISTMHIEDALRYIERLQELRDTENYHSLRWG